MAGYGDSEFDVANQMLQDTLSTCLHYKAMYTYTACDTSPFVNEFTVQLKHILKYSKFKLCPPPATLSWIRPWFCLDSQFSCKTERKLEREVSRGNNFFKRELATEY